MSSPALPCCLGHWALECLNEHRTAQLRHPESLATATYVEDHADHRWTRIETDRYGQEVGDQTMFRLVELFEALKIDDAEGYHAVIDGELYEL